MATRNPNFNPLASRASARTSPDMGALSGMRTDGGTQPRAALDAELVEEYAARMKYSDVEECVVDPDGLPWDPITLYFDGDDHWIADGFHRREAAIRAGLENFQVRVINGDLRAAVRASLAANARHGKRRTNEDKQRAVKRALSDAVWGAYSNRRIADMCKVTHPFVAKVRKQLEDAGELAPRDERVGLDDNIVEVQAHTRRIRAGISATAPEQEVVTVTTPAAPGREVEAEEVDAGDAALKIPAGMPRVTFKDLPKVEDDAHGALLAAPNGWSDLRTLHEDGLRVARAVLYPLGQERALVEGVSVWFSAMRDGEVHVVHRQLAEGTVLVISRERIGALTGSTLEELAAELGDGDAARVGGGA